MSKAQIAHDATEAQNALQQQLGHDHVHIKPYGSHLLIQMEVNGERDTVARITRFDPKTYGVAFRTHSGRWEPLPGQGSIEAMVVSVVENLGPYLLPDNY